MNQQNPNCGPADRRCSVAALSGLLRQNLKGMRRQYLRLQPEEERSEAQQWLYDNYYVVERETRQLLQNLRAVQKDPLGLRCDEAFARLRADFCEPMRPINSRELYSWMALQNKEWNFAQLSFLPFSLKAALLESIGRACLSLQSQTAARRMRYGFTQLQNCGEIDFSALLLRYSTVDACFRGEPCGVYGKMDEPGRLAYCRMVYRIALAQHRAESEVARELLARASRETVSPQNHVGYYLLHSSVIAGPRDRASKGYLATLWLLPPLLGLLVCSLTGSFWLLPLFWFLLWEPVRFFAERFFLRRLEPMLLPRLDAAAIEPEQSETAVVLSVLLSARFDLKALRERLIALSFANRQPNLCFCVLADFKESLYPSTPEDERLARSLTAMIGELNARYGKRFALFLRARTYSSTQNRFCGWERKRGAIVELVRYVKGERTSAHTVCGCTGRLRRLRFLLALDSDTRLLFDRAQQLICAAMHPLNQPVIDRAHGRVVSGYGVLVPRMVSDLHSARATVFSRIMSGCGGVTAYDERPADLYQELFGEGIFAGKGLVHLEAFYQLACRTLPENQILSHDILEGGILRAGVLADVQLCDSTPSNYTAWFARLERWMRGDWQNLAYLFARPVRVEGQAYPNPLGWLTRFQLFDNLRRSLLPVGAFAALLAAWFSTGKTVAALCTCALLSVLTPPLFGVLRCLLTGGAALFAQKFFTAAIPLPFSYLGQALFCLVTLPHQALLSLQAAARALWRSYVSRTGLLQWMTAAQSEQASRSFASVVRTYWPSQLLAVLMLVAAPGPGRRLLALLFCLQIPLVYLTVRPRRPGRSAPDDRQREELLEWAADMLGYYETFADASNHYLPPDNMQQSPVRAVAHRTSPTNIGMYLLALLAAHDLGLLESDALALRLERALSSVEKLPTFRGNLYNWYDTQTLQVLQPAFVSSVDSGNFICALVALEEGLRELETPRFQALAGRARALREAAELLCFYNRARGLFSVGIDAPSGTLAEPCYDFFMSEARTLSYYAIAARVVDRRHWARLGRSMSRTGAYAGAVSWTGTMFEYFMPHLLLPVYEDSLLCETLQYCIYVQRRRVRGLDVPWGISESAFYAFDGRMNYQYKAHGVQKLGVKQGLDRELVISPYSSFLVLEFAPRAAMENLRRQRERGYYGDYGFYEAIDFTPGRTVDGKPAVIRSYMAHHIGMSLVAVCNFLQDGRMRKRFMRNPFMASAAELLEEKVAQDPVVYGDLGVMTRERQNPNPEGNRMQITSITPRQPETFVLSNGMLTGVFTDTGAGFFKLAQTELTRRPDDLLRRPYGAFVLLHTVSGTLSATPAPFYDPAVAYRFTAGERYAQYEAQGRGLRVRMRCSLSNSANYARYRLVVTNPGQQRRGLELLFYLEPLLAPHREFAAHPAFSRLFLVQEYDASSRCLVVQRREKDGGASPVLAVGPEEDVPFAFEPRREALQSRPYPEGLLDFAHKPFSGTESCVDPVCALRLHGELPPGGSLRLGLIVAAGQSRESALRALAQCRTLRRTRGRDSFCPLLRDVAEHRLARRLAGPVLFGLPEAEKSTRFAAANTLGQSGLWAMGISGDLPIVLLDLQREWLPELLRLYLRAQQLLRVDSILFDLVVLYRAESQPQTPQRLQALLREESLSPVLGNPGGVFLVDGCAHTAAQLTLLQACTLVLRGPEPVEPAPKQPFLPAAVYPAKPAAMPERPDWRTAGGVFYGGRFYVDKNTLAPYCHILANPVFGTLLSDRHPGFTWMLNARENKLTPWSSDLAADHTGEALLLRVGRETYSLTDGARASFAPQDARYQGTAGPVGFTVTVWVPQKGMVKYLEIELENNGESEVEVMCAYYLEPVLGVARQHPELIQGGPVEGGLQLCQPYNTAVPSHLVMRCEGGDAPALAQFDRAAFLSGCWEPSEVRLPYRDPCGALIVPKRLPPRTRARLRYLLAAGRTAGAALQMTRLTLPSGCRQRNRICITTPDAALDQMINTFLPHQIRAARLEGRTGFYQCGGAYGFRDQLQDSACYLLLDPQVAKRQILRCCSVQFAEGDVLHWWHSLPGGVRGVRTRYSDDLLWLPLTVCDYLSCTGDRTLLECRVHYLQGEPLSPDEQERYFEPVRSPERGSVYEHCLRAVEHALRLGEKGLALMGSGDWNDGYNLVGAGGRGQSVWLSMFLVIVLERFAPLCEGRGDPARAARWRAAAQALREAVDRHAWDGRWYLRAFYDDGTPMGGSGSTECRIDSLPQSFAVLCGMPDRRRVDRAIESVWRELVDERGQLVRLFTAPFDAAPQQPGYVKAYPPGIRENGGQYTHAAVWFALALLRLGRAGEGWQILRMLNPAARTADPALAAAYQREPYYMAADIYTNPSRYAQGGWSLYTGTAGWYYRVVVQELLGVRRFGGLVRFAPRLPPHWQQAGLELELEGTRLSVELRRAQAAGAFCDGAPCEAVALDGKTHTVIVNIL